MSPGSDLESHLSESDYLEFYCRPQPRPNVLSPGCPVGSFVLWVSEDVQIIKEVINTRGPLPVPTLPRVFIPGLTPIHVKERKKRAQAFLKTNDSDSSSQSSIEHTNVLSRLGEMKQAIIRQLKDDSNDDDILNLLPQPGVGIPPGYDNELVPEHGPLSAYDLQKEAQLNFLKHRSSLGKMLEVEAFRIMYANATNNSKDPPYDNLRHGISLQSGAFNVDHPNGVGLAGFRFAHDSEQAHRFNFRNRHSIAPLSDLNRTISEPDLRSFPPPRCNSAPPRNRHPIPAWPFRRAKFS